MRSFKWSLLLFAIGLAGVFTFGLTQWFWIFTAGFVLFMVAKFQVRTWRHPAMALVREASARNWIARGYIKDRNGFRDLRFVRGEVETIIRHDSAVIYIMEPVPAGPFMSFKEVDEWIKQHSELYY